jgi:hypothetical protein
LLEIIAVVAAFLFGVLVGGAIALERRLLIDRRRSIDRTDQIYRELEQSDP